MSTKTESQTPSTVSSERPRLSLRRETVRSLSVRSGVKTGEGCTTGSQQWSCRIIITSSGPIGS